MASFVWVTRGWKKLDTGLQQLSRVTVAKTKKTVEKSFGLSIILLNQMKSYETFNELIEWEFSYIWLEALKWYLIGSSWRSRGFNFTESCDDSLI